MSVRTTLQRYSGIATVAALVVIVAAGYFVYSQMKGTNAARIPDSAYYTVDDGATFFVDTNKHLPPFDKEGKQAVRAHVFDCGGKQFVGFVSRFRPEAKALLEKHREALKTATSAPPTMGAAIDAGRNGWEHKKKGETTWTKGLPPATFKMKCDDGTEAKALVAD